MESDELVRQGNLLIAAARDGKIGLVEQELRSDQQAYLTRKRLSETPDAIRKEKFGKLTIGFLLVFGMFNLVAGVFVDFVMVLSGIFMLTVGLFLRATAKRTTLAADRYVSTVKREFPKVGNAA